MKIGIYQTYWGRVGGGQRYIAVVAEVLAREHDVEIVHHAEGFEPSQVEEPMQVNLSEVGFRYVPPIERPNWATNDPIKRLRLEREVGREISERYDLFIDSSDIPPFFNHARRGALLIHFPLVTFEEYHGRTSEAWRSRAFYKRWLSGTYHHWEWKQRFGSYDLFMVNSEFTKKWTRRLWGLDASVVFPPLREGLTPRSEGKDDSFHRGFSSGAAQEADGDARCIHVALRRRLDRLALCDDGGRRADGRGSAVSRRFASVGRGLSHRSTGQCFGSRAQAGVGEFVDSLAFDGFRC